MIVRHGNDQRGSLIGTCREIVSMSFFEIFYIDVGGYMRKSKIYSKIDTLPSGDAGHDLISGCLVVEGGAFRGVYAQGVMDALMQEDINMQTTIGVSAGALGGMNYVAGQIGRSAKINLTYRHDSNYVSLRHHHKYKGIINFDFLLKNVPNYPLNQERFDDPNRRYVAVVTNCETGKTEFMERDNCSDIMTAIQASASMPFVSKMVLLDGKKYLDGGCSLKVPFQWAMKEGYEKIIVIRTRHKNYRYEKLEANHQALRFYGKRYPEFAQTLSLSNKRYNDDCDLLDKLEAEGKIFVISPSETWSVGRIESDMEKLGNWYWLGYQDMQKKMESLKKYLQK